MTHLRPLRPDVPAPFIAIIQRALSAQPDQRFPSVREMARQIGTTLKKVQLRKDLHTVLARTVQDAREGMGLGPRTGDPSSATPIAGIGQEDTPRIELTPKPIPIVAAVTASGESAPQSTMGRMLGLRHKLPFFGRKRS